MREPTEDFARTVAERLRDVLGARAISRGRHVVVQADSVLDCDLARQRLSDVTGVAAAAWDHGWRWRKIAPHQAAFELTVYPAASR